MKFKSRFFLFSAVSLLLGLIILLTIFYGANKSTNITSSLLSLQSAIHNQALRSTTIYEIQAELWKGISACEYNETKILNDSIENINSTINKYNNYYIEPEELRHLSLVVDQNVKRLNNLFNKATNDALLLINYINSPDISYHIKKLDKEFSEINKINNNIFFQISDLRNKTRHEAKSIIRQVVVTSASVAIFLIFLICFMSTIAIYNIFRPLDKIIHIMKLVQKDNFQEKIPYTNRNDEIGDIAAALEIFTIHNSEKKLLESNAKKQEILKQEDHRKHMTEFAHQLESSIKEVSDAVALAASRVDKTAKELASQSSSIKDETTQLAKSSLKTNNNIQEVSKSSTEFIDSSNKITIQVTNAKKYSDKTSDQTINVNKLINKLEDKADAITEVIDLINHITSQIEILALNASIEASRAGEFGKGFTVVANEVKGLATKTKKATEQVSGTISSMQNSTKDAVEAIKEIIKSIETINDTSTSISAVIDEQNNTASRIVSKVSQIAEMSDSINNSIDKVAMSSTDSGAAALKMLDEAAALSDQASTLKKQVDGLLLNLKNGQ